MIQDGAKRIARLAGDFRIADMYVFGSRAKEIAAKLRGEKRDVSSTSDVDIGVRPLPGVTLTVQDIVRMSAQLEDLFGVNRVDLVVLTQADPYLALDIIRGELVYTADAVDQARHELYVLRRAADLLPFKKRRMELILGGHGR